MDRNRRSLLRSVPPALLAAVAGCVSGSDGGGPATGVSESATPTDELPASGTADGATATTTDRTASTDTTSSTDDPGTVTPDGPVSLATGETYETASGYGVTVENAAFRRAVVRLGTAHWDPIYASDGGFVVADVAVSTLAAPDPADLRVFLRTDTTSRTAGRYVAAESNQADLRQRLGFPISATPAPTEGTVVWTSEDGPEVRWHLPGDVVDAIARPPRFELRGFEVSDAPGDEVAVTVTVANVGEGDGVFLAEAGDAAMSDQPEIRVPVPAGETVTATRLVWAEFRDREELTVVLRFRDTVLERTLRRG